MTRRILASTAVFAAAAVAFAFLLLPIVAIFARVPPGELVAQLSHPVVRDALLLTLKTSAIAQALAAFEEVDSDLVAASRTLGAGRARTFFRVVLPLSRRGLAAGEALSFARGLGEFGATIMFAGSLQAVTQTLPLAIYSEFDLDFTTALAMSALLVVVSGALLVALRVTLQWQPSKPTP